MSIDKYELSNDTLYVQTSMIPDAGRGLFAKLKILKGSTICEYTGSHLTLLQTIRLKDKTYLMGGFGMNCHIDALDHPDVLARYINDARDPLKQNARFVKLKPERKALVVALRDIEPDEEIYASYGEVYWRYRDK